MHTDPNHVALMVVNQLQALVAYWDTNQKCVFSNESYRSWFGKKPEEMTSISLKELLGSMYVENLPYILGALDGKKQVFSRQFASLQGNLKEGTVTYIPNTVDGNVLGFSVHVTFRQEAAYIPTRQETLRQLLTICASCKDIQGSNNDWRPIESCVAEHYDVTFTHTLCPKCMPRYFPAFDATR